MRNACDSDSRCGLACDASARDAKSLAMWVERCEPPSIGLLSANSPALILSKTSGVSLAKTGSKSAKIG